MWFITCGHGVMKLDLVRGGNILLVDGQCRWPGLGNPRNNSWALEQRAVRVKTQIRMFADKWHKLNTVKTTHSAQHQNSDMSRKINPRLSPLHNIHNILSHSHHHPDQWGRSVWQWRVIYLTWLSEHILIQLSKWHNDASIHSVSIKSYLEM